MITSAFYGRMQYGRCIRRDYGYVGCYADVRTLADTRCSGRRSCRISVPDKLFDGTTPCPEDLKLYLMAGYSCVKGAVHSIIVADNPDGFQVLNVCSPVLLYQYVFMCKMYHLMPIFSIIFFLLHFRTFRFMYNDLVSALVLYNALCTVWAENQANAYFCLCPSNALTKSNIFGTHKRLFIAISLM